MAGRNGTTAEVETKVHDFNAVVAEARAGSESDGIVFTLGDREFRIPAPLDWPDELVELQAAAAANPNSANPVAMARAFLGDEQYTEFRARGGSGMHFMKFVEQVMGASSGESPAS